MKKNEKNEKRYGGKNFRSFPSSHILVRARFTFPCWRWSPIVSWRWKREWPSWPTVPWTSTGKKRNCGKSVFKYVTLLHPTDKTWSSSRVVNFHSRWLGFTREEVPVQKILHKLLTVVIFCPDWGGGIETTSAARGKREETPQLSALHHGVAQGRRQRKTTRPSLWEGILAVGLGDIWRGVCV